MKVAALVLVIVAVASSAPQPRKDFHEHFEDFMNLIIEEAGNELEHIMESYEDFEEFKAATEYMKTAGFREIVSEMESLPEFQAVVEFLETDNIDITYFLDMFDSLLDTITRTVRSSRGTRHASGTTLSSFIQDSIEAFPQEKLDALFQQKKAEDETFANAVNNLFSDEWDAVFTALWETPQFQQEVETLNSNGIDISAVIREIVAIFGQNK